MLIKLPVSGDYVDPTVNEVGAILLRKAVPGGPGSGVIVMTKMACFVIDFQTDEEAEAQRDAIAVRLGFIDLATSAPITDRPH